MEMLLALNIVLLAVVSGSSEGIQSVEAARGPQLQHADGAVFRDNGQETEKRAAQSSKGTYSNQRENSMTGDHDGKYENHTLMWVTGGYNGTYNGSYNGSYGNDSWKRVTGVSQGIKGKHVGNWRLGFSEGKSHGTYRRYGWGWRRWNCNGTCGNMTSNWRTVRCNATCANRTICG